MTGFIRGLFRSKSNPRDAETKQEAASPAPTPKLQDFYLSADDARTFGNVEYMRSLKSTRRTFSKKIVGEANEFIQSVSALERASTDGSIPSIPEKASINPGQTPLSPSTQSESGASQPSLDRQIRRNTDSSMNLFRSMVRDLKKRQ